MDGVQKSILSFMAFLVLAAACGIVYINYSASSDSFSLRKDSWECTANHHEAHSSVMLVGKVMIPQTSSTVVCDNWKRKIT